MKNGNWMGICRSFVDDLPHGRAYSRVEAAYSLQWDFYNKKQATVAGYADLWRWSRNKVRYFLSELGVAIIYPEDTTTKRKQKGELTLLKTDKNENGHKKRIINKQIESAVDIKNKNKNLVGHKNGHELKPKWTLNGQKEHNKNKELNNAVDIKGTLNKNKMDIRKDTTIESKEEIKERKRKTTLVLRENNSKSKNQICRSVVSYLNKKLGTNYKYTTENTKTLIKARLKEKYTEEDFINAIDNKIADWLGTEQQKYLRPQTLFGTKFESYCQEIQKPIKQKSNLKTAIGINKHGAKTYEETDELTLST